MTYQLITCIECGKQVSSSVRECPHCGTKFYRGVTCKLCQKTLKHSQAAKEPPPPAYYPEFYHHNCLTQLKQNTQIDEYPSPVKHSCPVCNKQYKMSYSQEKFFGDPASDNSYSFERLSTKSFWNTCDACGHRYKIFSTTEEKWPYTNCYCCAQLLYKDSKKTVVFADPREISKKVYAHKFCYEFSGRQESIKKINDEHQFFIAKSEYQNSVGTIFFTGSILAIASWFFLSIGVSWIGIICGIIAVFTLFYFVYGIFNYLK